MLLNLKRQANGFKCRSQIDTQQYQKNNKERKGKGTHVCASERALHSTLT